MQPSPVLNAQRHEEIIRELRQSGRLFEDSEFQPGKAIFFPNSGQTDTFKWLRPSQIQAGATFIKDGVSRFDINQGEANNCWFLVSVASLTNRPELLSRVVLPGQTLDGPDYCGAFRFRFMQFGREVEVMVDDRLPVDQDNKPLKAKPHNNEYWVCLLEKAFAKLHRSYQALEYGRLMEGMTDITGGVCESIYWQNRLPVADLLGYLTKCLSRNLFATAATKTAYNETGRQIFSRLNLVSSHAYSVTGVNQVEFEGKKTHLLRISNPWGPLGKLEWSGAWSDTSPTWTEEQKQKVGLVEALDGEGWMDVSDFEYLFYVVNILHLARNSDWGVTGAEWMGHKVLGEWTQNQDADVFTGDKNYEINFTDRATDTDQLATCLVSLEEPDQRYLPPDERKYVTKAVHIYRPSDLQNPVMKLEPQDGLQKCQMLIGRIALAPGRYIVVPKTLTPISGDKLQFLMRVFTEPED